MVTRLTGALLRAAAIMALITMPYLILPGTAADTSQIVVLLALIAGIFTLVEYVSAAPSVIEFRDAPPFNRLRFLALFVTVLAMAMIQRGHVDPSTLTRVFDVTGSRIGAMIDFPYSPVRLVLLILPPAADAALVENLRTAAGISYLTSLVMLLVFVTLIRFRDWPVRDGAFNVWVNLPTFDPTAGGDVVERLNRDAHVNLILGFLLPFMIPAAMKLASDMIDPISLADPFTLIWTMTAWAFLPASLLMRGIALLRVAQLITDQRRRAFAEANRLQPV
ncbi:MAG: hypothetical protein JJT81_10410 [Rubellimicrobium sp.]|nr:hypothetical protein [Rubellimicrobium sp.]